LRAIDLEIAGREARLTGRPTAAYWFPRRCATKTVQPGNRVGRLVPLNARIHLVSDPGLASPAQDSHGLRRRP
jgi:hypothetical protein